jgi:predicted regulator of Ras-like GTPase activity (Roadblock/LC7/MglB family)
MDASAALERLRDISSQVRSAVVFERGGKILGATFGDDPAKRAAAAAEALLEEAERRRSNSGAELAQLEVALPNGSVFVVRHGERLIAATTPPEPTVGLVFYDLKSTLRELEAPAAPKKKPASRRAAAPKQAAKPKQPAKPKPKPRAKPRTAPKRKPDAKS